MALMTYDPWRTLARLQQEMARAFDANTDGETSSATADWAPAVDIREEANRYVLIADVPGVEPDQIEVTAENGVLTLRGERRVADAQEQRNFKRVERFHGAFHRRFALPDAVDTDQISATCRNGVLEVAIPKHERLQPRRVPVSA
jgi:HSP20 family protein